MQWQLSPSVIVEAGTGLGILIVAVCFPWRDVSRRARLIGSALLIIAALWILTHALEIGIPVASYKASLMGLQLIWGLLALTLWLLYIIHYTATGKWQTGRINILFGIIPLLAILALVTNNVYGLMWTDPGLNINNPYLPLEPAYGPVYWVCMAYMGALIVSGSFLIFKKVVRQHNFRGWEPWILILAVVIPLIVAFLEVMGVTQSANLTIGLTPFFSGIGSIILVWSLPRFHLQNVIPIARDTVFEQIGDSVVVLNMQNRVVDLNPAAEHLAGYTNSEALGLPVEKIWTNWPSRLEPASTVFEELTLTHAGEQRTYSLHFHTITDHKSRPLNKVVLLIDTTERKRSDEEIRKAHAELEIRVEERTSELQAANKEMEAFAYSVSHDLRAPLHGIDGWSQALLEDYKDKLDERGQQYLNRVRSETQRMGRLIDDLIMFSRQTRSEMEWRQLDMTAMVQNIISRLQQQNPALQVDFAIQTGLTAQGDSRLLEIALVNLLDNAVKFSSKNAHSRIEFGRVEQAGSKAFFVRDNGVGFDMAYANKLFGVFQRLHSSSEFPGTGIGLATVQRVINRHGGRIWAEAQVNQGATFYFTLKEGA